MRAVTPRTCSGSSDRWGSILLTFPICGERGHLPVVGDAPFSFIERIQRIPGWRDCGYRSVAFANAVRHGDGAGPAVSLRRLWSWRDGSGWLSYCRSTPEFDQLGAHFFALMPNHRLG